MTKIPTKHTNDIPEEYKNEISDKTLALLSEHEVTIHLASSKPKTRLNVSFLPFASIPKHIPIYSDYYSVLLEDTQYIIHNNEITKDINETIKTVLQRIGLDVNTTYYWPVYLHELDSIDAKYRTKLFKTHTKIDSVGTVSFAGFAYKTMDNIEPRNLAAWRIEQEAKLACILYNIESHTNYLHVEILYRDAQDGILIAPAKNQLRLANRLNHTIQKNLADIATAYRNHPKYMEMKAEHKAGIHAIPVKHQHLVSDDTKQFLYERDLRIKVSEIESDVIIDTAFIFAYVPEFYPENLWSVRLISPYRNYTYIEDDELCATVDDTAASVMARLHCDSTTMSYWPVYLYESDTPMHYGHTRIYTTDIRDFPASGGDLVGIAFRYKHDLTPEHCSGFRPKLGLTEIQEEIATMTIEQKADFDIKWERSVVTYLYHSLLWSESWINTKHLDVSYYKVSNSDFISTHDLSPTAELCFNEVIKKTAIDILSSLN